MSRIVFIKSKETPKHTFKNAESVSPSVRYAFEGLFIIFESQETIK
ncbi:MAG: hypothetical protein R2828_26230 [Saprospiraceae bacterium]